MVLRSVDAHGVRRTGAALNKAVIAAGLRPAGPIRYAHFDPPWTPLFLRRNEVVLTVEG